MKGVLARFFYTRKFTAAQVLQKPAVQMLMKIKFGHVGTPELKTRGCQPSWRTRLYEAELLSFELFPQSRFFGDRQRIIFKRLVAEIR